MCRINLQVTNIMQRCANTSASFMHNVTEAHHLISLAHFPLLSREVWTPLKAPDEHKCNQKIV